MDRYEFNLKTQQMRKLSADGRYDEAALIADEIDWSRVKNTRLLMLTADIYAATKQPEKEFDVLDIAYERSPMGKQLAYRLALVASELKEYDEAENYYKDYVDMAPNDSRRFLLRYRLSKARGEDLDLLIGLLERYLDGDMEERWTYELCELYAKAGYQDKCISLCDELITWFGEGKYVFAALKLKRKYAPLSVSQQQKYDAMKQDAKTEQSEDEEEVGTEIARTRNELLRNRTISEKMQAVAEKRIQDDAGTEDNAEAAPEPAEQTPVKQRPAAVPAEQTSVKQGSAAVSAEQTSVKQGSAAVSAEQTPVKQRPAEAVDGMTRRYDGKAVRRAEVRTQQAWDSEDTFELHDEEEELPETAKVQESAEDDVEAEPDFDVDQIHIKTYSDRAYDTINIQAELAKSMESILRTDETRSGQKAQRRSGTKGSGPAVRTYVPPMTGAAEDDPFGYEQERREPVKQITGQMSIEEILKDLQTRGILKEDTVESALRVTGQLPLWKTQMGEENPAEETPEETADAAAAKKEAAGVSEENVVKEMEEISLRDFTTGEIDLDIVQNEVDERRKQKELQTENMVSELKELTAEETKAGDEPETAEVELPEFAEPTEEATAEENPEAAEETLPEFGKPAEEATAEEKPEAAEETLPEFDKPAKETQFRKLPEFENFAEETVAKENPEAAEEVLPKFDKTVEEMGSEEFPEFAKLAEETVAKENPEAAEEVLPEFDKPVEETKTGELPEFLDFVEEAVAEENPKAAQDGETGSVWMNADGETESAAISAEENDSDAGRKPGDNIDVGELQEGDTDTEDPENDDLEFDHAESREQETEDFLSGLEMDLSKLGQEENPYTQMRNEDVKRETEKMDDVFAVIREMETDLSEEDRIYNAYTEEEPKDKLFLNEEDRKEFDPYLKITGMESQIAKAIGDYVSAYSNDGSSKNPNILITGGAKTGKSQLAVSLIRAINRHLGREGRKTARISGFNLNRKTLNASMPRLLGNDLLIEHAGEINRKIVAELMEILPKYTGGMIVVMEDEKARLDHLFEEYPLLADYFPNHLDIKEYDINEWAAVAKSYARSQGYTIDELGTLALYAEIDALYGKLQGLEVDDIKDIVDDAIEHSERKIGTALARIFGKKKENGHRVLRETDFDA